MPVTRRGEQVPASFDRTADVTRSCGAAELGSTGHAGRSPSVQWRRQQSIAGFVFRCYATFPLETTMVKAMPTESETLDSFISRERKRLQKAREDALSRRQRVEDEITTIDRELKAMDAYHAVKHGETKRRTRRPSPGPRGSKRQQILELIKQNPDGLSRGDIINRLAVKGNKSGERSVSNALTGLKKQRLLDSRGRKYIAMT